MSRTGFTRMEAALVAGSSLLVFSRVFGLSLVLPNFRGHYDGILGMDPFWVGIAFGAYGLTMALMQLPAGLLSDRIGRKPLLLGGTLVFVAGSLLAAVATTPEWLVAARLVQGLGAVGAVAMAAVGETVDPARRTLAMALVGIPAGGGFLVGMAVGPLLYPYLSMPGLFVVSAAVASLAVLPLLGARVLVRPGTPSADPAGIKARPPPSLRGTFTGPVAALALGGFTANYFLTTTLFFLPLPDPRVLVPLLVVAMAVVLGTSRRIDQSGLTWQPITAALVALAFAAPLFALGMGPAAVWIGGILFFTVHATLATTLPSQVSRLAGRAGGRGHGVQATVAYTGTFAGGAMAGALAGAAITAFVVAGVLAVAVAALVAFRLSATSTPSGAVQNSG